MFSTESELWIFMYNPLILVLATNFFFFFPIKQWEQNLHNKVMESAFSLCRFFISGLDLGLQWGQRGI